MVELGIFVVLLVVGYGFGSLAERRHYRSIIKRENELNALPAIASRHPPEDKPYQQQLVVGNVVVASDYFKSFLAGLVNFFGGAVVSYESLLDRGRREALLRMKKQAEALGAEYVFNVKYETMAVGGGKLASMEVMAYGTALTPGQGSRPGPSSPDQNTFAQVQSGSQPSIKNGANSPVQKL